MAGIQLEQPELELGSSSQAEAMLKTAKIKGERAQIAIDGARGTLTIMAGAKGNSNMLDGFQSHDDMDHMMG